MMDGPSAAERELQALRIRAYGPHADIEGDPAALARLAELEAEHAVAAHAARYEVSPAPAIDSTPPRNQTPAPQHPTIEPVTVAVSTGDSPQSLWQRATSSRSGRVWLIAGVLVAVLALTYAVTWLVRVHPDATLHPNEAEPDGLVNRMAGFFEILHIDTLSLRGFESYRGIETWAAEDVFGNPCFIAFDRPTEILLGAECTPSEMDLITDVGVWPLYDQDFGDDLPNGSVIRFHDRGDTVDVHLYPASDR